MFIMSTAMYTICNDCVCVASRMVNLPLQTSIEVIFVDIICIFCRDVSELG